MSQATPAGSSLPVDLVKSAMQQSKQGRGELAAILLESLDDEFEADDEVPSDWVDEFSRRIEEIESGKVQLSDGQASLKRLREELRERHGI
jgi:putative addiction module component